MFGAIQNFFPLWSVFLDIFQEICNSDKSQEEYVALLRIYVSTFFFVSIDIFIFSIIYRCIIYRQTYWCTSTYYVHLGGKSGKIGTKYQRKKLLTAIITNWLWHSRGNIHSAWCISFVIIFCKLGVIWRVLLSPRRMTNVIC